jgi:hypothetical protein
MITDRIKKEIEKTLKSKVEAKKEKEEEFQGEIEEVERNLSKKIKDLMNNTSKSKSKKVVQGQRRRYGKWRKNVSTY